MSENLTDVDQFDSTIAMPVEGETNSAGDLRDLAIQKLANRTYYNQQRAAELSTLVGTSNQIEWYGWMIGSTDWDGVSATLSEDTGFTGLSFKDDGAKMYALGTGNDTVYQYSLSTEWDISTASYDSTSIDVSSQTTAGKDIRFKTDGTAMYVMGGTGTNTVYQYTIASAWDLSTASYASKSFLTGTQDSGSAGLFFKTDGLKMYMCGTTNDTVYQYTLGTAWDVSTASYDSVSLDVSSETTAPASLSFSDDGFRMQVSGSQSSDEVFEYILTTAWDLSTAAYSSKSVNLDWAAFSGTGQGIAFSDGGMKMYVSDNSATKVLQFSSSIARTT